MVSKSILQDWRRHWTAQLAHHDKADLNVFVVEDKDLLKLFKGTAREQNEVGTYLTKWGNGEGVDIRDVTDKTGSLLHTIGDAFGELEERYAVSHAFFTNLKTREEEVQPVREKYRALEAQLEKLKKAEEKKPLPTTEAQIADITTQLHQTEAELVNREEELAEYKRVGLRKALRTQFDAFRVLGQKLSVLGTFGGVMASQIPIGMRGEGVDRASYKGHTATMDSLTAAMDALKSIKPVDDVDSLTNSMGQANISPPQTPPVHHALSVSSMQQQYQAPMSAPIQAPHQSPHLLAASAGDPSRRMSYMGGGGDNSLYQAVAPLPAPYTPGQAPLGATHMPSAVDYGGRRMSNGFSASPTVAAAQPPLQQQQQQQQQSYSGPSSSASSPHTRPTSMSQIPHASSPSFVPSSIFTPGGPLDFDSPSQIVQLGGSDHERPLPHIPPIQTGSARPQTNEPMPGGFSPLLSPPAAGSASPHILANGGQQQSHYPQHQYQQQQQQQPMQFYPGQNVPSVVPPPRRASIGSMSAFIDPQYQQFLAATEQQQHQQQQQQQQQQHQAQHRASSYGFVFPGTHTPMDQATNLDPVQRHPPRRNSQNGLDID
ncbi:hypothetical protein RI367_001275 [Sorochytrium milnesiophthora]